MDCGLIFLTKVNSPAGKPQARLLIESIQEFGGAMRGCPVWVFAADPGREDCRELAGGLVAVHPLAVPTAIRKYPFGDKVFACATAERLAPPEVDGLVWLDLECLVVQPPVQYALGKDFDAALRPVHIRNVGLPPEAPLDAFWRGIYAAVGVDDLRLAVNAFIDDQPLRAYFNSHAFAVRPGLGLFQRWYALFEALVCNQEFQASACPDELHQIFLFQALLSALVAASIEPQRLRLLPPTYNYPYNLHGRVPAEKRPAALNELATFTFEGRDIRPEAITDIETGEPLRSWLQVKVKPIQQQLGG